MSNGLMAFDASTCDAADFLAAFLRSLRQHRASTCAFRGERAGWVGGGAGS